MSRIIQNPTMYPEPARAQLVMPNERGGRTTSPPGGTRSSFCCGGRTLRRRGQRPAAHDHVTARGGTGGNVERRRQYLTEVTDRAVADLTAVRDQWNASSPNTYAARLIAGDSNVALRNMLPRDGRARGHRALGERLTVAYEECDQEDEHDCFSDNTHNGIVNDAAGIQNVWLTLRLDRRWPRRARPRAQPRPRQARHPRAPGGGRRRAAPSPRPSTRRSSAPTPRRDALRIRATIDAPRRNGWSIVEVSALGLHHARC